jgi:hypothetical protein
VCWSHAVGTVLGADILLFVRCTGMYMSAHGRYGLTLYFLTNEKVVPSLEPFLVTTVEGRVCWSHAAGMVGVDLLNLVHCSGACCLDNTGSSGSLS